MLEQGLLVAERYEVESKIGTGGMSDVYKAKDLTLGRCVAIKVLKQEFCEDMNFVTKFRTEAQSAAGLEHPNIVNVYDVGSQDGFYYIIMEYVEGITLKTYIEKKGRLNYKETLSIAIQVGRGIQAAHAKSIIHRDIKPQNIIISKDGKVKVTDFGIARAVSENTIHSDVMGSVHYVSPEQARNGYVSNRSDIYSLGIVMYEMITGRVPFDGESTVAVAIKHLQDEMVPPSTYAENIPISLEKIILKCTQKSADRRYDSMESLLVDLRKSLLSPNEDFVTLVPFNQDKTRVLTEAEVKEIQEKTSTKDASDQVQTAPKRNYIVDDDDDDDDDDDGFINSKVEKVINVMRVVIMIIIILIVIYIIGSLAGVFKFSIGSLFNKDKNTTDNGAKTEAESGKVEMISLLGMTVEEAEEELKDSGIQVKQKTEKASDQYEAGQIMEQSVEEGEMVDKDSTVYVTVSSGKENTSDDEENKDEETEAEEITVEDVVGKTSENAMSILEGQGFEVTRSFEYSASVESGVVMSQNPKGGNSAKKGSAITIVVSQGKESSKVPGVVGQTQDEAKKALEDAGISVGAVTQEYSDTVEEGKVISQSVEKGNYVDAGTSVDLVVSQGPEQKTTTYYIKSKVTAPTNVTVQYADIKLYKSESDEIIESWDDVTEFPFYVEAHGIEDVSEGTIVINWYYTDSNGTAATYEQDASVKFSQE